MDEGAYHRQIVGTNMMRGLHYSPAMVAFTAAWLALNPENNNLLAASLSEIIAVSWPLTSYLSILQESLGSISQSLRNVNQQHDTQAENH